MKFDVDISKKLITDSRAPQGARGLKSININQVVQQSAVAPRKGRVD